MGGEDLDWYALLDEALPEAETGSVGDTESARVVIRLPETMAPTSEADAEQVRQLQAKLEARGVHGETSDDEDTADHPAQRLDSKKLRAMADDESDAGHQGVLDEETKDYAPGGKKDEDETRDNPGPADAHGRRCAHEVERPREDRAAPRRVRRVRGGPHRESPRHAQRDEPDPERPYRQRALSEQPSLAARGRRRAVQPLRPRPGPRLRARLELAGGGPLQAALSADLPLEERVVAAVVLVTSASKGEGKTTVAANLALVAAPHAGPWRAPRRGGPARRATSMRSFGLRMKAEGLLEALESGKDPASDIDLQFKLGMLDVLPLGVPGSDAAELISSDRIGEVIRGLSQRYLDSVVIIDGSSVLHAPDPLVLARHVDGVVLVVRADATPREQIERARDLIGPEKVLGVVLNQAGS